ncbi:MAG: hypothetical protein AAF849_12010 [Bacteroidota bacterium]
MSKRSSSSILKDVQANILKPHARDYVRCIFLRFGNSDSCAIKNHLGLFQEYITSASKQKEQAKKYKENGRNDNGTLVTCIYLSKFVYEKINIPDANRPSDPSFRNGMKSRNQLNDPVNRALAVDYQEDIDTMILVAGNDNDLVEKKTKSVCRHFKDITQKNGCFIENGERLFYRIGDRKIFTEHFGYRDGISNPVFFKQNKTKTLDKKKIDLVLDQNCGSYLVFRKLQQDVSKFNSKISELSKRLGITRSYAEAQVMGRFKDGTPLGLFSSPNSVDLSKESLYNNASFDEIDNIKYRNYDDLKGNKCPFHAHIRQMNPRNGLLKEESKYNPDNTMSTMARRSIPYDNHNGEVGLLFMSFQRNIYQQFVRQHIWANRYNFVPLENQENPNNGAGLDPIIGQRDAENGDTFFPQRWSTKWDKRKKVVFDFSDVVSFKGGEYFYAPPISFFKNLVSSTETTA